MPTPNNQHRQAAQLFVQSNWRSQISHTSLRAFQIFCERQGVSTDPEQSGSHSNKRRLYHFALQACSPGAYWIWHPPQGGPSQRYLYNGVISINDASRYFGDMNTSWRPRVTELYQDGWLRRHEETRVDPLTGEDCFVHSPSPVIAPPRRRPQPAKLLRDAIPRARRLCDQLDPADPWTQQLIAILYSDDMLRVIPLPEGNLDEDEAEE